MISAVADEPAPAEAMAGDGTSNEASVPDESAGLPTDLTDLDHPMEEAWRWLKPSFMKPAATSVDDIDADDSPAMLSGVLEDDASLCTSTNNSI